MYNILLNCEYDKFHTKSVTKKVKRIIVTIIKLKAIAINYKDDFRFFYIVKINTTKIVYSLNLNIILKLFKKTNVNLISFLKDTELNLIEFNKLYSIKGY